MSTDQRIKTMMELSQAVTKALRGVAERIPEGAGMTVDDVLMGMLSGTLMFQCGIWRSMGEVAALPEGCTPESVMQMMGPMVSDFGQTSYRISKMIAAGEDLQEAQMFGGGEPS